MDWAQHRAYWPAAASSRFVDAGGLRWHVQIMGEGPSLLLLHGTGSGTFSWRGLLPALAQHFRVIVPDLPGHAFTTGASGAQLSLPGMSACVGQLLTALEGSFLRDGGSTAASPIALAGVVGHSAGAAVAAHLVLHDERLQGATLVGLNPAWLPLPGAPAWFFGPAARLVAGLPLSARVMAHLAARPGAVERLLRGTGSVIDAEGLRLYAEVLAHEGHVQGVLDMMARWDLRPLTAQLSRVRQPVYLDIGARDLAVPPRLADEACRLMPQAVKCVRPGLGHLAHEEDPLGTVAQILQWCAPDPLSRKGR